MARPHVEFVQSQSVEWQDAGDGTAVKRLNIDPDNGDGTVLRRYPAGSGRAPQPRAGLSLEFYVLDGEIAIDGRVLGAHAYGYRPAGTPALTWQTSAGALVLEIGEARPVPAGQDDPAILLDCLALPWDVSTYDPQLRHMHNARKVLRLGPGDSGRTFLLAGLPHGFPSTPDLPLERHPHGEEMFLIQGEMKSPQGVMRDGAYFYRPPGIWHGLHVSEFGFLMLMRSPGANKISTQWSEARHPVQYRPAFDPVLPEGAPAAWGRPHAARPTY
ncbi:cupin domain-containing protein [Niveispirillum fermenti]|uniref:cupin domain-containing protein n=1 Tax=Niveispirillum fermenti TaxID=1233113 RepID=UPI003A8921C1